MDDVLGKPITVVTAMIIVIILIASGYFTVERKLFIDTRTLLKNDAYSIYSILIELDSSEQGYAIYTQIDKSYNITLTDTSLIVKTRGTLGPISYVLHHNLENVIPANITNNESVCIVKKVVNCKPQITLCSPMDRKCCNIGETIC